MNIGHSKRHLGICCLTLVLASCGFHLRGMQSDNQVSSLNLHCSDEASLACQTLRQTLQDNSVSIDSNAELGLYVGDFSSTSRETASGGRNGNTREVELIESYQAKVLRAGEVLAERRISSTGQLQYQTRNFLGNEREAGELRQHLQRENAISALRFINAQIK